MEQTKQEIIWIAANISELSDKLFPFVLVSQSLLQSEGNISSNAVLFVWIRSHIFFAVVFSEERTESNGS